MSDTGSHRHYTRGKLTEDEAGADPVALFGRWFTEAEQTDSLDPNAMALATVDTQGRPSVRIVLLKDFDEHGFVFYTNLGSRKAKELAGNPRAALAFYWDALERQVRVEGVVEPVTAAEADAYFASRDRGKKLSAWASTQSEVIANRDELEKRFSECEARFPGEDIPRPPHWSGFRVVPGAIEFWQGRASRLHDRFRFERAGEAWHRTRLSP